MYRSCVPTAKRSSINQRSDANSRNSSPGPSPRATASKTPAPPPRWASACAASGAAGESFSVRPCFALPYMVGYADEVQGPLFLRAFGVPFWALARVFGRDAMYWYRLEVGLGRNSVVGTTVRRAELPEHLLADEHHQTRDGDKNYVATTVAAAAAWAAPWPRRPAPRTCGRPTGSSQAEAQDARARLPAPDGERRRLGLDAPGVAGAVPAGGAAALLPARLAEHPEPGQAERVVRRSCRRKVWEPTTPPTSRSFAQRLRRLREWARGQRDVGVAAGAGREVVRPVEGVRAWPTRTPAATGRATCWTG